MTHIQFEVLKDNGGLEVKFMLCLISQDARNKLYVKDDTVVIMGVGK